MTTLVPLESEIILNSGGTMRTMTINGDLEFKLPVQTIDDLIQALEAIKNTNFCTAKVYLEQKPKK